MVWYSALGKLTLTYIFDGGEDLVAEVLSQDGLVQHVLACSMAPGGQLQRMVVHVPAKQPADSPDNVDLFLRQSTGQDFFPDPCPSISVALVGRQVARDVQLVVVAILGVVAKGQGLGVAVGAESRQEVLGVLGLAELPKRVVKGYMLDTSIGQGRPAASCSWSICKNLALMVAAGLCKGQPLTSRTHGLGGGPPPGGGGPRNGTFGS